MRESFNGRAPASQAGFRGFDSRLPLQKALRNECFFIYKGNRIGSREERALCQAKGKGFDAFSAGRPATSGDSRLPLQIRGFAVTESRLFLYHKDKRFALGNRRKKKRKCKALANPRLGSTPRRAGAGNIPRGIFPSPAPEGIQK